MLGSPLLVRSWNMTMDVNIWGAVEDTLISREEVKDTRNHWKAYLSRSGTHAHTHMLIHTQIPTQFFHEECLRGWELGTDQGDILWLKFMVFTQREHAQERDYFCSSGPVKNVVWEKTKNKKLASVGKSPSKLNQELQVHKSGCGELSSWRGKAWKRFRSLGSARGG